MSGYEMTGGRMEQSPPKQQMLEQLRELSCSEHLTQDELDVVMAAIRHIEARS